MVLIRLRCQTRIIGGAAAVMPPALESNDLPDGIRISSYARLSRSNRKPCAPPAIDRLAMRRKRFDRDSYRTGP
jgi:hypothetical protein